MQGYFSLYRGRRQKITELLSFFDIPSHTLHYSKIDDLVTPRVTYSS